MQNLTLKLESVGPVDQTFSFGNDFERKVTIGPHSDVCSKANPIFGPSLRVYIGFHC